MSKFTPIKQLGSAFVGRRYGSTKVEKLAKTLRSVFAIEKEGQELESVHKEIVDYLTNRKQFKNFKPLHDMYKNMIDYNVKEYSAAKPIIAVYKAMVAEEELTERNVKLATVLGWCCEAIVGRASMVDDALDGLVIRRGKLPWYKQDNVGLQAVNHASVLESSLHLVVSKYFGGGEIYRLIMEVFQDVVFNMATAQMLEGVLLKDGKPQLELYTPELFNTLTFLKTGHSAMRSSIVLASHLANKYTEQFEVPSQFLGQRMGALYHANTDFVNSFESRGDKAQADTDVAKGKCTWLVTTALQKATPAQKDLIKNNYGQTGAEAATAIRNLYEELELSKDYTEYESKIVLECLDFVAKLPDELFHNTFSSPTLSKYFKLFRTFSNKPNGNAMIMKLIL